MGKYDLALKYLVIPDKSLFLSLLAEGKSVSQAPSEIGKFRQRTVDAIGQTSDGEIIHVEFQNANDHKMPWRMLDYAMEILRHFEDKRRPFPRLCQWLIYVGKDQSTMPGRYRVANIATRYRSVNIHDLNTIIDVREMLQSSPYFRDWILALLCIPRNYSDMRIWKYVLDKVNALDGIEWQEAIAMLQIVASRRIAGSDFETELRKMPFDVDAATESEFLRQAIDHGEDVGVRKGMIASLVADIGFDAANQFVNDLTSDELWAIYERLMSGEKITQIVASWGQSNDYDC